MSTTKEQEELVLIIALCVCRQKWFGHTHIVWFDTFRAAHSWQHLSPTINTWLFLCTYIKALCRISRQFMLYVQVLCVFWCGWVGGCHRLYEVLTAVGAFVFHRNWSVGLCYLCHGCIHCPQEYLCLCLCEAQRRKFVVEVLLDEERHVDRVIMDKDICVCCLLGMIHTVVIVVCVSTLKITV